MQTNHQVMDMCNEVRSTKTNGPGFIEREFGVLRSMAGCRGDDTRIAEAEAELADLRMACAEGWRYADELEQERKRLSDGIALALDRYAMRSELYTSGDATAASIADTLRLLLMQTGAR